MPTPACPNPHGVCLLRPIRTERTASAATPFESLGNLLSSHRAVTRVSLAALAFTLLAAVSQQPTAQAGPKPPPVIRESLLPQSVGIAIDTEASITIPFDTEMDAASVESTLHLLPAQQVDLAWNDDRTALSIRPQRLWRTDEHYLVVVSAASKAADGSPLRGAERYSFTTATAPAVADFQVHLAGSDLSGSEAVPADATLSSRTAVLDASTDTATDGGHIQPIGAGAIARTPARTVKQVSASTSISIDFSAEMDAADVERHFTISPDAAGDISWVGDNLVFTPSERLEPGMRYTISVVGAHDRQGNALGGKANFSFIVQAGAQLTKTRPDQGAEDVEPGAIVMWFSQPMDTRAVARALRVTDLSIEARVKGRVDWNAKATQLTFRPNAPFAAGHAFRVALTRDAVDVDGNRVAARWKFRMTAPPPPPPPPPAAPAVPAPTRTTATTRSAPAVPAPAPATSLAGYALNQVNAARKAYGFAPLVLDAKISAVAAAHAWDQARNGYFSHYGRDGSSRETRLSRGGVGFGWSGENQCYLVGMSQQATLNWCHQQFMAEPYPGHWNHIANILNPDAKRMGVGIATVGGKIVIVWDFTD
jgi:uncharacterized protein YkwD